MKTKILLLIAFTWLLIAAHAQTVVIDIQESGGGCSLNSNCDNQIICFDLLITVNEPGWQFASYNIWTEYPAPPVMSHLSDNACLTQNGGDTDNDTEGQYRVSGINGLTVLQPNVPTVFHSICFSYSDEYDIRDSVISSGGTISIVGFPFYSTITLVKASNGTTVGITIPQKEYLILNETSSSCLVSDMSIEKSLTSNADNDASGTISLGDVLTYTITATNTGVIYQKDVEVTDPILTPSSITCPELEKNETCVLTGTYTVTQADVDAGHVYNEAIVVTLIEPPLETDLDIPVPQNPQITTEKFLVTPITGPLIAGASLTYSITVTNTGNITLHNVSVSDPKISPSSASCPTLAPGSSCILTGTHTVTQAEIDAGQIVNTATGDSDETPPVTDELITPLVKDPEMSIFKTLLTDISGGVTVGDILIYSVTTFNSGNTTLNNVTVTDSRLTPALKTCSSVAPLGTCTLLGFYIVKQSDVNAGQIVNTGTGDSDETSPVTHQVTTPIPQFPFLSISKVLLTDVSGGIEVGDVLTYQIVATNTGNIALNNVTISDPGLTPGIAGAALLQPLASLSLTGSYTVGQADIDAGQLINTATGDSDQTPPVTAEVITPVPQYPSTSTEKTMLTDISGGVEAGDVITYQITVTNTGNITLNNVTVTDPMITPSSATCPSVAPLENCILTGTYTITQDDIDNGSIENTGTGDSDETDPDPDILDTPIPQNPEISTVKTMLSDLSGGVTAGDAVTYQVTVTNTGNLTLHNVTVSDPKITPSLESCSVLSPGQSCSLTGVYLLTQDDIDAGQVTNTGTGNSDETGPEPDELITPLTQEPDITLVKTMITDISGGVSPGDIIEYTLTATNTGNVTLNNVVVTDLKLTPAMEICSSVMPGGTCVLTGSYEISVADLNAGQVTNNAYVDSDETDPVPVQVITPLTQDPSLLVTKTASPVTYAEIGQIISYTVKVENTGNVTITGISVTDPLTGLSETIPSLDPLQSVSFNSDYTIQAADLITGSVLNTATASGEDPNGDDVEDTDGFTITELPNEIIAFDDDASAIPVNGYTGGTAIPDVLTNDLFNGAPVLPSLIVLNVLNDPNDGVTLNPLTGEVTVDPQTPAGIYYIEYEICEALNPTNCDPALITVTVERAPISAIDDDASSTPVNGYTGGTAIPDVLANDLLHGNPVIPSLIVLNILNDPNDGVTLNPLTGEVTVDPQTPAGTYYIEYEICEILNPANCDPATITVVVAPAPIEAVNDDATANPVNGYTGGTAIPDVLENDLLNGDPVNPALIVLNVLNDPNDGVTLNPLTGEVTVDPQTPAGTYYIEYEICEILNPANCDPATITIEVAPAPIEAVNDDATANPVNGYTGGTAIPDVLVNDLLNGDPVNPSLIVLNVLNDPADGVTLNPFTGEVTVDPQTPAGTYTIEYEICEILNPTNCDPATIIVEVSPAAIIATDDDASATPVNGYTGGTAIPDVLVNDLLNGDPVLPSLIVINVLNDPGDGVTLNPFTGEVTVDPQTPAGTYTIEYEICEILNPTNCDPATIIVEVSPAAIIATDDDASATPVNGYTGGTAIPDVLVNDLLNGDPVLPSLIVINVLNDPADGVTLNPLTGEVTVDPQTVEGTYYIEYEICEVLNPVNCDPALITVAVSAAPILAVDDDASGTPVSGYTGGTAVNNVLSNDLLNGDPVLPSQIVLNVLNDPNDGVALNPLTGEVTVDPQTPAGTYYIEYEICEVLNPANCDEALITVEVIMAPIEAKDDDASGTSVNGYTGGTAIPDVLVNDLLNGDPVIPSLIVLNVLNDPADGVTLNPLTGEVTVDPQTPAGTYTIEYEICELLNPSNCDPATITVVVAPAEIVATDDDFGPVNEYTGSTNAGNALDNDLLNGVPVSPSLVVINVLNDPTDGVTLNPLTGVVAVDPNTPAGIYTIEYEICEALNPSNCDPAIISVSVIRVAECPAAFEVCLNDQIFELSGGIPMGGIYSGDGVFFDVYFDPMTAGTGIHEITYTYTEFGFSTSCTFNITVNELPLVQCPADFEMCISSGIQTLGQATPAGGYYEGDGVFIDLFNPEVAGPGDHLITYYYTDASGCANTCSFTITVNDIPAVTCPSGIQVCEAEPAFILTGTAPSGGFFSINGTAGDLFDPSVLGEGYHLIEYSFTDAKGCSGLCSYYIEVIPVPEVELGQNDTLLCTDFDLNVPLPYHLTAYAVHYSALLWSSNGTGSFNDPSLPDPVYTFSGQDILNGSVTFTLHASSAGICSLEVSDMFTVLIPSQLIEVPAGWSGVSSYIHPFNPNIVQVTNPCKDELIVQVSIGGVYWPEQNVNTMISWTPVIGYKVKYAQPCCLPIFGNQVTWPSLVHLNVGVNYIPVHSPTPVDLREVFGADTAKVILLVDIYTVQVYNPGFGIFNTLEYLEPGIGYLAYMAQSTNITYPTPTKSNAASALTTGRKPFSIQNRSPWNDISNTGFMHMISFEKHALQGTAPGDFIGAFDMNGTCMGMAEVTGGEKLILPVFGDDPYTPDKEGLDEGEYISYKLFRNSTGEIMDIRVVYDASFPNSDGLYATYGLSGIIKSAIGTTSVDNPESERITVFPSPANDQLYIRTGSGLQQVRLINHIGQSVAVEKPENAQEYLFDVSNYPRGVYIIEVKTGSGMLSTHRVILQ